VNLIDCSRSCSCGVVLVSRKVGIKVRYVVSYEIKNIVFRIFYWWKTAHVDCDDASQKRVRTFQKSTRTDSYVK